ncbi:hypothetical protein AB0F81_28810 [Actinoplanes sp. NPDC024001]|uniref:hypothetical protein n=1 Tax=Actinoplanes sp. NPDC024001 TaxID=3154598 RepID=UPI0033FC2D1F
MTRTRIAVTLCLSAALALTGCGAPQAASSVPAAAGTEEDVDLDLVAMEEAGLDQQRDRPGALRKYMRRNTLHGEVTVQAKDGVRTLVVQRGKITAVSDSGITVESTDGFRQAWSYGDPLRIRQDRKAAERTVLRTGVQVGVGGLRDGDVTRARLILVQ